MFISAQNIAPFYVMKQTNNFFSMFLLLAFNFNCHYWFLVPSSSTIPVVEDKSLKTQYQVSYVLVEAQ